MSQELSSFFSTLHAAKTFDQAASETLRAMLEAAGRVLEASRFSGRSRLLRGLVHVRPDDAYRRLAVLEPDAPRHRAAEAGARVPAVGQELALLASASAWRAVMEHGSAIAIDVNTRTLQPVGTDSEARPARPLATFPADSQRRMLGRQATHVCVLPLRGPGGRMEGMISLEAECMAALGQDFIWREACGQLQLLADLAVASLTSLPPQAVAEPEGDEFLPVIGQALGALVPVLRVFAQQEETILISGPTGAGKSRLARWCHERSGRRQGRFESLDLTTVPEELQMGELFGWRKGAFTGAVRDNPGSVARAEGGTLFIDEVDKLSLKAQAGLLQVLEQRMYRVLGEGLGEPQRANVRFLIGTNANLREAVRRGAFREDLYYRINVLPIRLPPLDERRDEIPLWARYMVNRRHDEKATGGMARITPEAEHLLLKTPWPGNLRQLDNIIRRAYTLAMVDQGPSGGDLALLDTHVRQALDYEGGPEESRLIDALCHAATAFVQEARRRKTPLDIDLAESFRGFVLGTAARQLGRDEAFRLLGRESLVKSRNHQKALRRELEKVETFCREVGQPMPEFLARLAAEGNDTP